MEHRLSALLQLHLHSQLNTWRQWIGQRQLQDETRNVYALGMGAAYTRELTIFHKIYTHGLCYLVAVVSSQATLFLPWISFEPGLDN